MMAATSVTLGLKLLKAYWHVSKLFFWFTHQTETRDSICTLSCKALGNETLWGREDDLFYMMNSGMTELVLVS